MLAGRLGKGAVLKAICAGFEETTEPAICLSGGKFSYAVWWKLTSLWCNYKTHFCENLLAHIEEVQSWEWSIGGACLAFLFKIATEYAQQVFESENEQLYAEVYWCNPIAICKSFKYNLSLKISFWHMKITLKFIVHLSKRIPSNILVKFAISNSNAEHALSVKRYGRVMTYSHNSSTVLLCN